jgi:hypothetical protein
MPRLFLVPDSVWEFYVKPQDRNKILCLVCFKTLVNWKDGGEFEQLKGKVAGWPMPGFPLPDGGYKELWSMSAEQRADFFRSAKRSGYWDWLKTNSSDS